ncbi:MAG: hypothetical protein QM485_07400 [Flavobacteriaceae bacterium]
MAIAAETQNIVRVRKKLIIEGLMALVISITPVVFYFYEYLPKNPDETWNILGIVITNFGFPDVSTLVWYVLSKTVPLYLMIFWFLTCKHWWYHAIIIPIAMYAFQLITLFTSSETAKLDKEELMWLLPVCMAVIPFVYFVRVKLFDKHVNGIDLEAMEAELKQLKAKRGISEIEEPSNDKEQPENQETKEYQSFSEVLDEKLSTQNLEFQFKRFQHSLKNWLHLKF